jgi:nucleotide-binding universal stress UspA family protein
VSADQRDAGGGGAGGFLRVLVGFDGSDSAADALALAQRLLDPRQGALVVAHVDADRMWSRRRSEPRGTEALAPSRAQLASGIRAIELACASASVPRGLTELAEQERADLVVVGSSRSTPAGRTSPGRTALRLLQGAPCAVAIAAAGRRDAGSFHHVGIAYDGSAESAAARDMAYAVAARDGAAVSLYLSITVGAPVSQAGVSQRELERATLAPRLEAQGLLDRAADMAPLRVNPRTVLLHGDPAREIPAAADGILDLLFAGSRGYGPMHRALAGSVSEGLLRLSTQPVVVMPRSGVPADGETSDRQTR